MPANGSILCLSLCPGLILEFENKIWLVPFCLYYILFTWKWGQGGLRMPYTAGEELIGTSSLQRHCVTCIREEGEASNSCPPLLLFLAYRASGTPAPQETMVMAA